MWFDFDSRLKTNIYLQIKKKGCLNISIYCWDSSSNMYNSSSVVVYEGDKLIGEVDAVYVGKNDVVLEEIKISHLSNPSERCTPLAVLHTISNNGVCFKLECKSQFLYSQLNLMHSTCLRENKVLYILKTQILKLQKWWFLALKIGSSTFLTLKNWILNFGTVFTSCPDGLLDRNEHWTC